MIITIGIVLATISAPRRRSTPKVNPEVKALPSTDYLSDNLQYASGILMLAMALFLSSCLGIFQEETYRLHGKKWREGLFYCVSFQIPHSADVSAFPQFTILPALPLFIDIHLRGVCGIYTRQITCYTDSIRSSRHPLPQRRIRRKGLIDPMATIDDPLRTRCITAQRHHSRDVR